MIEIEGDIFDFINDPTVDAICITTNGIVGSDEKNVMGMGVAGIAASKWPDIRKNVGKIITNLGNVPGIIGIIDEKDQFVNPNRKIVESEEYKCLIFSYPTKEDYRDNSDIELIIKSAYKMVSFADKFNLSKVMLPVVGCGVSTGRLNWEQDVKPKIKEILDDRFYIVELKETNI